MLFCSYRRKQAMKNIDEIADTIDVLKKRNKEPIGICNSYIAIGVSK